MSTASGSTGLSSHVCCAGGVAVGVVVLVGVADGVTVAVGEAVCVAVGVAVGGKAVAVWDGVTAGLAVTDDVGVGDGSGALRAAGFPGRVSRATSAISRSTITMAGAARDV